MSSLKRIAAALERLATPLPDVDLVGREMERAARLQDIERANAQRDAILVCARAQTALLERIAVALESRKP